MGSITLDLREAVVAARETTNRGRDLVLRCHGRHGHGNCVATDVSQVGEVQTLTLVPAP